MKIEDLQTTIENAERITITGWYGVGKTSLWRQFIRCFDQIKNAENFADISELLEDYQISRSNEQLGDSNELQHTATPGGEVTAITVTKDSVYFSLQLKEESSRTKHNSRVFELVTIPGVNTPTSEDLQKILLPMTSSLILVYNPNIEQINTDSNEVTFELNPDKILTELEQQEEVNIPIYEKYRNVLRIYPIINKMDLYDLKNPRTSQILDQLELKLISSLSKLILPRRSTKLHYPVRMSLTNNDNQAIRNIVDLILLRTTGFLDLLSSRIDTEKYIINDTMYRGKNSPLTARVKPGLEIKLQKKRG